MLAALTETANEWLAVALTPHFWWQGVAIAVAALLAMLANRRAQKLILMLGKQDSVFRHIALRTLKRLLWPVAALALLLPAKAVLDHYDLPTGILGVAVSILIALALIRVLIYLLRKGFTSNPLLKSSESFIATLIWLGVALHLLGWLPAVLGLLDSIGVTLGEGRITLLSMIQLVLMVVLAFTLALWMSGVLSGWLKASENISPSMQVGFGKFVRFLLLTSAFLLALNAAGIDLGSLAIFGGALGVGLGFGLQKITSNFISGFILVMDRSIKPGDVISVGEQFGWVEELNARYVVVRNREGVDTLIPNENLITSEVINWSYSDRNVRVTLDVDISYDNDPEQAMQLMLECAFASPRVIQEPQPTVRLLAFGDSGMHLNLRVWIADPENGANAVRSDILLAIWRAFKAANITIPYPQRDLHIKTEKQAGPSKPA